MSSLSLLLSIHLQLIAVLDYSDHISIIAAQISCLDCLKSTKVRSHGNCVRDVIIAHVISWDTETDAETAK